MICRRWGLSHSFASTPLRNQAQIPSVLGNTDLGFQSLWWIEGKTYGLFLQPLVHSKGDFCLKNKYVLFTWWWHQNITWFNGKHKRIYATTILSMRGSNKLHSGGGTILG